MVSRFVNGNSRLLPGHHEPVFAEAQARTAQAAEGGAGWSNPRERPLPDIYMAMGQTAENLALLKGISRAEMDEFGVRSQNLAERRMPTGSWRARSRR